MTKKKSALKNDSFLLIPASVIHDPRISTLAEAAIFSLILGFSRKGELMRGGQAFAAEWTMLSSKWAGKTLLSLEQKGLISLSNLIPLATALGYTQEVKNIFQSPKYATMEELTLIRRNMGKKRAYSDKK